MFFRGIKHCSPLFFWYKLMLLNNFYTMYLYLRKYTFCSSVRPGNEGIKPNVFKMVTKSVEQSLQHVNAVQAFENLKCALIRRNFYFEAFFYVHQRIYLKIHTYTWNDQWKILPVRLHARFLICFWLFLCDFLKHFSFVLLHKNAEIF